MNFDRDMVKSTKALVVQMKNAVDDLKQIGASTETTSYVTGQLMDLQNLSNNIQKQRLDEEKKMAATQEQSIVFISKRLQQKIDKDGDAQSEYVKNIITNNETTTKFAEDSKNANVLLLQYQKDISQKIEDKETAKSLRDNMSELIEGNDFIFKTLRMAESNEERREIANTFMAEMAKGVSDGNEQVAEMINSTYGKEMVEGLLKEAGDMTGAVTSKMGIFTKLSSSVFAHIHKLQDDFYKTKIGGYLKHGFEQIKGVFESDIKEIMGDIGEMFGSVWGSMKDTFSFFKGDDDDPEKVAQKEREEHTGLLKGIKDGLKDIFNTDKEQLKLDEQRRIDDLLKKEGKGKSMFGDLFSPIVIAGLALGAILGAIVNQFKMLFFVFKYIPVFSKGMSAVGSFFGKVGLLFLKLTTWVTKFSPMAGTFMKAFAQGFSKLAIPLQILLSAIDFLKGFMGTEGDFIDKLKGGLWAVVEGLISLPVKIIGWAIDKMFGLDSGDAAGKMMEAIKWLFDTLMYPLDVIGAGIDTIMPLLLGAWEIFKKGFEVIAGIFSAIGNLLTGDWSGFIDDISNIGDIFKEQWKILFDSFGEFFKNLADIPTKIWEWVSGRLSSMPLIGKFFGGSSKEDEQDTEKTKKDRVNSTVDGLAQEGVINKNVIGKSKIKGSASWERIRELPSQKIQDIIDYDDWDDNTLKVLETYLDKRKGIEKIDTIEVEERKTTLQQVAPPDEVEERKTTLQQVAPPVEVEERTIKTIWSEQQNNLPTPVPTTQQGIESVESDTPSVSIRDTVESVDQSNASAQKRIGTKMEDVFARHGVSLQKGQKDMMTQLGDTINNTTTEGTKTFPQKSDGVIQEPPVDIEALGILFFNKTWGMG